MGFDEMRCIPEKARYLMVAGRGGVVTQEHREIAGLGFEFPGAVHTAISCAAASMLASRS
jgi:hypothetical protein